MVLSMKHFEAITTPRSLGNLFFSDIFLDVISENDSSSQSSQWSTDFSIFTICSSGTSSAWNSIILQCCFFLNCEHPRINAGTLMARHGGCFFSNSTECCCCTKYFSAYVIKLFPNHILRHSSGDATVLLQVTVEQMVCRTFAFELIL